MILTFTVPQGQDRKVYTVLRRELRASAALVRRLKNSGGIKVNGESAFTDRMMRPGDVLTADISGCEPVSDVVPENGEIDVIYEDEGLAAVNKAPGIIVHPSHSRYTGTLSNFAAGYFSEKGEPASVHVVNRLDRDTSGVVLLAKNSYMKALASEALGEDTAVKEYKAVVYGKMPAYEGVIDAPILRLREGDIMRGVGSDGQRAVTRYKTVAFDVVDGFPLSLLSLTLETGRTHQIRVHCAHLGCPVLGDGLYGSEESKRASESLGVSAQLLHAEKLTFTHPISGENICLFAPIVREDMGKIVAKFHLS